MLAVHGRCASYHMGRAGARKFRACELLYLTTGGGCAWLHMTTVWSGAYSVVFFFIWVSFVSGC